jgi:hypothetical protein
VWTRFDPAKANLMVLRPDNPEMRQLPFGEDRHCRMWDELVGG